MNSNYRQTEILSSSPERLIPLLYEKLIVSLRKGSAMIERQDYEAKFECLSLAQDIIAELMGSLNFEAGGDLATRLASLYAFWTTEISAASRELDAARLERVTKMVCSLHEAWEPVCRIASEEDLDGEPS